MAPKSICEDIRDLKRRLKDETSGEQDTPDVSGSVEEHSVRRNQEDDRPQTWAMTRLGQAQTRAIVVRTPQFDEGDNNNNSSIHMTPFGEESGSELGSSDALETKSSVVPP